MLTDIWFTPGYTFANFWYPPGFGGPGPGNTPHPKNPARAPPPPPGVCDCVYIAFSKSEKKNTQEEVENEKWSMFARKL